MAVSLVMEENVGGERSSAHRSPGQEQLWLQTVALSALLSAHTDSLYRLCQGGLCPDKPARTDGVLWCQVQIGFLCESVGDWKPSV